MMLDLLHWAAWLPTVAVLVTWAFRGRPDRAYSLTALGFAVSFFADIYNREHGGTWVTTHLYPAPQLGLFAVALKQDWVLWLLVGMMAGQILGTDLAHPDVLVTVTGSALVLWLSRHHPLAPAMVAYCFVATSLYVLLVMDVWRPSYALYRDAYQASRLTAFALFGRAVWTTSRPGLS